MRFGKSLGINPKFGSSCFLRFASPIITILVSWVAVLNQVLLSVVLIHHDYFIPFRWMDRFGIELLSNPFKESRSVWIWMSFLRVGSRWRILFFRCGRWFSHIFLL